MTGRIGSSRLRRFAISALAVAAATGSLVADAIPARAAAPWYVSTAGSDGNDCQSAATSCRTINGALAKPGFVAGDVVHVAAGTYLNERPVITKAATIVGAGAASTIVDAGATSASRSPAVTVNIPAASPNQAVSISGLTITGGWSNAGGGIAHYAGDLRVSDSVVTGNRVGGVANDIGGGGIFVLGRLLGTNPTLALDGVTVSNNQTVPLPNTAPVPGAGVYLAGPATITDSTITGNTITGIKLFTSLGGGIFVNRIVAADDATLTATNTTISGNKATYGGGVLVNAAASASFTGGSISSNTADYYGGGAYLVGVGALVPGVSGQLSLDGTTVSANVAGDGTTANTGLGGGIVGAGTLSVTGGSAISGNRVLQAGGVSGWGGGLYVGPMAANDKPDATLADTTIDGGGLAANAVNGGGLAVTGNVFNLAGTTPASVTAERVAITGNTAVFGAGAYVGSEATFRDSSISGNVAHAGNGIGGGLYVAKNPATGPAPRANVEGTAIDHNSAASGGGIGNVNGSVEVVGGSSVDANSGVLGAGIYNGGELAITDSGVSGNQASYQGGGLYNGSTVVTDEPTVTATDATIDGNTALAGGGAVVTARASLSAVGGSLSSNGAASGGGLYVTEGAGADLDAVTMAGNTSTGGVGGAILNSGTTTVSDSLLTGNEAVFTSGSTGWGGAIYSGSSVASAATSLTIDRSTITGNEAHTASALMTRSTAAGATNSATVRSSTISGNRTEVGFASVVPFHAMTITGSTITGNTSPAGATGGLYHFASPNVSGSILSGNSGGNCSAPVADGGFNLTDAGDATCGLPLTSRVDPQLGPLAANGGPTATHLPRPTSPAIDAIPAGTTGLCDAAAVDQRGVARPQGAGCDIGAVEADVSAPTVDGPTDPEFVLGASGSSYGYTSTGVPAPALAVAGPLPDGLTFVDNGDGTGTLSGTPTGSSGTFPVTVVGSNGVAPDFELAVTITVNEPGAIGGPAAATYVVGEAGGPDVFTTTGFPTASLSVAGALPAGVGFVDDGDGTATISGTPEPGTGGTYAIVITATNGVGQPTTHAFTLTVEEAAAIGGPAAATYVVGEAGGPDVFTTTGFPTASLSVAGALPAGVGFVDDGDGTATISGTPEPGTGGTYAIVITATNGVGEPVDHAFTLTVNEGLAITGPTEVRFVIGAETTASYSTGGFPVAALDLSGDALPAGLSFTDNGNGTATLGGTAEAGTDGTYVVTITAGNGVAPDVTTDVTITVVAPVEITTATLPAGAVGAPYAALVEAEGGVPPYTYSVVAGALPAGLTLASDGTISGTPTGPSATSTFTVQVTDSLDPAQTDTRELSITIDRSPTTLTAEPVVLSTTGGLIKVTIGKVSARLTGGTPAAGLPSQTITFKAGATTVCTATTGADGTASCTLSVANTLVVVLSGGVTASYAGSPSWLPASRSAGLL